MRRIPGALALWAMMAMPVQAQFTYSWSTFTTTNSGLPDNLVTSLQYTSADTLWIGTASGLAYVVDSIITTETDFPAFYITALGLDENEHLWIGTAGNGCYKRLGPGNYVPYTTASTAGGLTTDQVLSLHCDGDSTWIGTDGEGLFLFYNNAWTRFHSGNHPFGWSVDQVHSITTDALHRVWYGTSGIGVVRKSPGGQYWKFDLDSNLRYNRVQKIRLQGDTLLWIGMGNTSGDSGLARLDLVNSSLLHYCDTGGNTYIQQNVWDIFTDSHQRIWIASNQTNHGLLLYNDTVFSVFDQFTSGLLSNRTYALAEDNTQKIWVGSFYGLSVNKVISTLAVPQVDELISLQAYPNPVQEQLTLSIGSPTGHPAVITICDLQGRVLLSQHYPDGGVQTIAAGSWAPGVYLLRITAGNLSKTLKIIKI